jgi:hypothetical protein
MPDFEKLPSPILTSWRKDAGIGIDPGIGWFA